MRVVVGFEVTLVVGSRVGRSVSRWVETDVPMGMDGADDVRVRQVRALIVDPSGPAVGDGTCPNVRAQGSDSS